MGRTKTKPNVQTGRNEAARVLFVRLSTSFLLPHSIHLAAAPTLPPPRRPDSSQQLNSLTVNDTHGVFSFHVSLLKATPSSSTDAGNGAGEGSDGVGGAVGGGDAFASSLALLYRL
ncbi:hypothetical protein KQX54_004222 [Cotesia glomerata]|uniref:Uncharacterized protein n=1 Tax=Cotesia glomerata TaxID=32391 RepID=A0AAV7IBA4_COTGL|nr:hypothetical protein KQX54_004222 [Cotesia glomerata]